MVLKKKKRFLSGVLVAAVLMSAIPVSVYADTGQILSDDDQDAVSIAGWVGNIDTESNFDFNDITKLPGAEWYQHNNLGDFLVSSPMDSIDGTENIIEYCPYYKKEDNSNGTIYKDYPLNNPGYSDLSASCQIVLSDYDDIGKLKIEVYDNTTGTGSPINSASATAVFKSGEWDSVSISNLYVTSKAKMIRVVLEASTRVDPDYYIDFDGLSVTLAAAAAPPIISNLDGDIVSFTEGGSAVSLDQDGDVTVKVDSDFGRTYGGGSVTASISGNGVATEDVMELAQTGDITLSGSNVLYSGTTIGTYYVYSPAMSLSILLNANASDTSVAALIKAIMYSNTNIVRPDTNPRTIRISASDNTYNSESVYTTVDVQSVNYAPVRKSGVEASASDSLPVKTSYSLDLSTIFEDADLDILSYKVKIDDEAEVTAVENFFYTPGTVGTHTLVFKANDGIVDSSDSYTVTLNTKAANIVPARKLGVDATLEDSVAVRKTYYVDLDEIFEDANGDALTYKVTINSGTEETADADYSFTPTTAGVTTLVFRANDGSADSADTYKVTLTAVNTAPKRINGTGATKSENITVNATYTLDLSTIFEDENLDALNYKVKVEEDIQTAASKIYSFTPNQVRTYTLEFTANDGIADSIDTYKVILNVKAVNTPPARKSGVSESIADSVAVQRTYSIQLNEIFEDADGNALTYKVEVNGGAAETADAGYSYKPTAAGTTTLVFRANDGSADSTDTYTITLTATENPVRSITSPAPVTGIANGTAKTASAIGLPENVSLETDDGIVSADATWDVAGSSYDPDQKTEQTFTVEGTVTLPDGVMNPDNVSLNITVDVTVDAESTSDKVLERIISPDAITGITNGAAKTVSALGIPGKITVVTNAGNVKADVIWDLDSSSYDPDSREEQSFSVEGTVVLPDHVINPDGISLEVSLDVTVLEEEIEQEYYTLRIKVTKRPDKVSYTLGEDLDTEGLEVTEYQKASPSDAVRKTVLSEHQYDLVYNLTRTGTHNVKVVCYGTDRDGNEKEFTDEFIVRVKNITKNEGNGDDDREITEPGKGFNNREKEEYYSGGWKQDENGWKLTGESGSEPVNRWVYTDWKGSNDWYFFDEKGYMVTGWFEYQGNQYYLNPVSDGKKGYMFTGWNMIEGKWYYFSEAADDTKGSMLKDTVTPDGHRVGPDGERIS